MTPYHAGVRTSRTTGEPVYVFEFKLAPKTEPTLTEQLMDALETYIAKIIIAALHKSAPKLSADDDAKVNKAVQDFVTTAMDLAAVYFALRNAKS